MPRKAYMLDLDAASKQPCFHNISHVKAGADDGELVFLYRQLESNSTVQISALIPDVSDYPKQHDFHVFASEDAPESVARALQGAPSFSKLPLLDFLPKLSEYLDAELAGESQNSFRRIDSDGDVDIPDSQLDYAEDSDTEDVDNQDWALEEDEFTNASSKPTFNQHSAATRARADLRALKDAGFKMGLLGSLATGSPCYPSASCRIQKLGISEEAMEAWHVDPSSYLILLMHYPRGYVTMKYLESVDAASARSRVDMRVGVSNTYKVTCLSEAQVAFQPGLDNARSSQPASELGITAKKDAGFRETFISQPLNGLLNERLVAILKYRLEIGLSWSGAEKLYERNLGSACMSYDHIDESDLLEDAPAALPPLVTSDAMSTYNIQSELSFPLLAMQFLLRHFVRCTEFCLVCHAKLESQIEAIKPYVCDNPLCLFQYMNLGFGPSIEYELVTQPLVVDLLISFCYSAALNSCLTSYPEGLGLSVPHPSIFAPHAPLGVLPPQRGENVRPAKIAKTASKDVGPVGYKCRLNQTTTELLFDPKAHSRCPIRKGDWIVIESDMPKLMFHCRVSETVLFPTVRLGEPVPSPIVTTTAGEQDTGRKSWTPVTVFVYDQNFDTLEPQAMSKVITMLLDLLPSVEEMRKYLARTPRASLSWWGDRMNPSALGLLRWIIASNRSCIMQVDRLIETENASPKKRAEERVQGIPSWLQFRFAMGAPDKEQRFLNAISSQPQRAYKSIFAWHGSPLRNWHSIIREGLHYNKITHGRGYGDGCYHAKEFNTSIGYAKGFAGFDARYESWRNSVLQITTAVALSEIVNAPDEFVSQSPFYVVSQLDWIQTRYLFVLPSAKDIIVEHDKQLVNILEQDPARTPSGPSSTKIVLPLTAIAKSRRPHVPSGSGGGGRVSIKSMATGYRHKLKDKLSSTKNLGASSNDDAESVDTQPEDLEILFDLEDQPVSVSTPFVQPPARLAVTDFIIRSIPDLPLMPAPQYATSAASKRLQKDFLNLISVQESHMKKGTLPELGWYVDQDHITQTDNLYQWILQLHSFPLSLPLANDMKSCGIQSIVLEIRFHATYPFSPPFVRVVRPRFLPFQNGGGGHVTAGGSICMDLLTSSGWTAVSDIESVLLQIRMAIMSTDPRPARLLNKGVGKNQGDYGVGEAVEAFKRAARMHGWVVPEGLDEVAFASQRSSTGT